MKVCFNAEWCDLKKFFSCGSKSLEQFFKRMRLLQLDTRSCTTALSNRSDLRRTINAICTLLANLIIISQNLENCLLPLNSDSVWA